MIKTHKGDILQLKEGILVHGCNCQGVMGGGIAKLIRDKWLPVYDAYRQHHARTVLRLGDTVNVGHQRWQQERAVSRHLHALTPVLPEKLILVNAMSQHSYGREPGKVYVDYDAIGAAFSRVKLIARDSGLAVHFPLIGCGLANGRWQEVAEQIERALGSDIEANLWILE